MAFRVDTRHAVQWAFTFLITILSHKQPAEPYRSPAVRVRATPLLPSLSLLRTFLVRFFRIIRRLSRLCARSSFYRLAVVGVVQASGLPNIGRPFFWELLDSVIPESGSPRPGSPPPLVTPRLGNPRVRKSQLWEFPASGRYVVATGMCAVSYDVVALIAPLHAPSPLNAKLCFFPTSEGLGIPLVPR